MTTSQTDQCYDVLRLRPVDFQGMWYRPVRPKATCRNKQRIFTMSLFYAIFAFALSFLYGRAYDPTLFVGV